MRGFAGWRVLAMGPKQPGEDLSGGEDLAMKLKQ